MTVIRGVLWLPLFPLLASYAGAFHAAADSLAVFRLELASLALCAAFIALCCRWRVGTIVLSATAFIAAGLILLDRRQPDTPDRPYTIYQKNLLFKMATHQPIIDDIVAQAPDFLTLQELSARNRVVLTGVAEILPHQVTCPFSAVGDVAIASRWPIIKETVICQPRLGMIAAQTQTPDGDVWLVSLHLYWPWPHGQRGQAERILAVLESLDGPIVIGGDFNMVPWSHIVGRFEATTQTQTAGTVIRTLPLHRFINLPIDHILAPVNDPTQRRPLLGSDHFGVVARIGVMPDT